MICIDQPIARLQTRRNLIFQTSTTGPLRLGIRINFKSLIQQVAIFGVYITSTNHYFLAIGRKLKLVYEIDYPFALYQQVQVSRIFESKYILLYSVLKSSTG